jgi:hypothetical protein
MFQESLAFIETSNKINIRKQVDEELNMDFCFLIFLDYVS